MRSKTLIFPFGWGFRKDKRGKRKREKDFEEDLGWVLFFFLFFFPLFWMQNRSRKGNLDLLEE